MPTFEHSLPVQATGAAECVPACDEPEAGVPPCGNEGDREERLEKNWEEPGAAVPGCGTEEEVDDEEDREEEDERDEERKEDDCDDVEDPAAGLRVEDVFPVEEAAPAGLQ